MAIVESVRSGWILFWSRRTNRSEILYEIKERRISYEILIWKLDVNKGVQSNRLYAFIGTKLEYLNKKSNTYYDSNRYDYIIHSILLRHMEELATYSEYLQIIYHSNGLLLL